MSDIECFPCNASRETPTAEGADGPNFRSPCLRRECRICRFYKTNSGGAYSRSPVSAELIKSPAEAVAFYETHLARAHEITSHARTVTIVFESGATHLFSEDPKGSPFPDEERVERVIPGGRIEVRRFNVARARLMGHVLPALSSFTVSTSALDGKRLVYGPNLGDGRYMRVVLRPGPGSAYTCVSAYPVEEWAWKNARRDKAAKFPP